MEALGSKTAKLPYVEITKPEVALGRSTIECIQGGLYFGFLGMIKELVAKIKVEAFADGDCVVVATGEMRLYIGISLYILIFPYL